MPKRIQTIYNKINNEVKAIKEANGYKNLSNSFGHFFIKSVFNIDDVSAKEALTDGGDDNGIDAIYISGDKNRTLNFFQFKYPSDSKGFKAGFTDEEIVKLSNGTLTFLSGDELDDKSWNAHLIKKHNEIKSLKSYTVKLWVVRYTDASIERKRKKLEQETKTLQRHRYNTCEYEIFNAEKIMNLYESRYENLYPTITLHVQNDPSPQKFNGDNYKSINTVCSIKDLYDAVNESRDQIFDGNVRFYNSKTPVTAAIRKTLEDYPKKLMLLNNGITILSRVANYNPSGNKFTLESASIINGAQTVGSILDVLDKVEDKTKYEESKILVRILEIKNDEAVINDIVNSLNTQTKMFTAFNISKDSRLRDVQDEINEDNEVPYFLEIKYNEFNTLKSNGKTNKKKKDVVNSEKMIQLYTAFHNINEKAHQAKLKSSELFDDNKLLNKVLDELNKSDAVQLFDLYYGKIQKIITQYRGYIKDSEKNEILSTLNIRKNEIVNYRFLLTGDILVLFATGIINKNTKEDYDTCVKKAIKEIRSYIKKIYGSDNKVALSNITKLKKTFEDIQKKLYTKYTKKQANKKK